MPLTMLRSGDTVSIKKISGKDETRRHLEHLGFTAGENVTLVNDMAGNVILGIRGVRVALSKTMASRIMI